MDEMNDLLSELKAEYGQPEPEKVIQNKTPPPQKPLKQNSSSPLDYLLAEVKDEYELAQDKPLSSSQVSSSSKQYKNINPTPSKQEKNLLEELQLKEGENKSSQYTSSSFKQYKSIDEPVSGQTNNLLQELQTEFKEQEKIEQQQRQQEHLEKQRLEEQRQQRKQLALTRQAQEWLNKLNPKSEEGRWFEEFSYSYDSKLQAAIHYLEALRETGNV